MRKIDTVEIQQRLLKFIIRSNWILFFFASILGFIISPPAFARGIIFGGLIVTINFHLLSRTLKKSLAPPHISSHNAILVKYYIRFIATGFIIFVLIAGHLVDPLGLVAGLSVVVVSITFATLYELKKLFFKEAV